MNKTIVLLLALAAAGGLAWQVHRRLQQGDSPSRQRPDKGVTVALEPIVRATLFEEAEFTGTLHPQSRFILAPKVPGRLVRLLVDIGDTVKKGDLIAALDNEEYTQQVAQAQAELDVARAALEEAESGREMATNDLIRITDLHGERVASDAQLDETRARHRAMQARTQVARAQIRQRESALQTARTRLAYTSLHAEWEGDNQTRQIAERFADEGSMLRANDPVVSIVDTRTLIAVVFAIERDFAAIKPGLPVVLRADAYPDRNFEGRIVRKSPTLDEQSRQARVEIEIENPDNLLAPGMFARVVIRYSQRDNARVVPLAALARRDGQQGVFLVDEESLTARFVPLQTGLANSGRIEVIAPEIEGRVVTLGRHLLEDGAAIVLPPGPQAEREQKPAAKESMEQRRPESERGGKERGKP